MREPYGDLGRYNSMLLEKSISAIYEVSHRAVQMLFLAHGGAIAALVVFANPAKDDDGGIKGALVAFFLGLAVAVAAQILLYVGHRGEMESAASRLGIEVPTIFSGWVRKLKNNPYHHAFRLIVASLVLLLIGGVVAVCAL